MLPVMIVCLEAVFALFSNNSFPKKNNVCVCVDETTIYMFSGIFRANVCHMYVCIYVHTSYGLCRWIDMYRRRIDG